MMGISHIAQMMRRDDYDLSTLTQRDKLDAVGAVLAYIEGQWYETEYGQVEFKDRWYGPACHFIEEHYARCCQNGPLRIN